MLAQISTTNDKSIHLPLKKKILLVEDEVLFAKAVVKRLQKAGFECEHAETLHDARLLIKQFEPDMALLDMRLPDGNGLDLLSDFVAKNVNTIVMTAFGDVTDAVNAIKMGAIDYLKKPIDLEELLLIIQKNEKTTDLQTSLDYSRQRDTVVNESVQLIGESAAMQSVRQQIARIAQLSALSDAVQPTVLIAGETGTGKDVVARYLHAHCENRDKPFVHVDCASLPSELIESELFGHEKGAFTNAVATRPGLIESAEDGTLFLDEIGELPLGLQAKLLNVLERRMVRRLGSTKERPVQARIIAATNRDLYEMSNEGRFRSDLYYRLNVITMQMPPLRDRGQDILLLAYYFKQLTEKRYALPHHEFSSNAMMAIQSYDWPGNVREMRHQISRAVLMCTQPQITDIDLGLPQSLTMSTTQALAAELPLTLEDAEKVMLLNALEQARNNVSKAARILGITRMTMRYRMDKHGIAL
ncbi:sigma-54-dependent transcriptional regulator [Methylophilus aquaticus]|uniref:Sigma-54 dependent transcriptional regulator n=1 Tax=Methylophilus aquaticus TaxID=1971610 RepID=A0ABT9JRE3_9PROT|nr:sigma-54 dependent transcriptional regulator [Methylophilus aquaticus]MDP8567096.1 sigma-54 dependent transcriptional regulator [Methylophilus aquaticus]